MQGNAVTEDFSALATSRADDDDVILKEENMKTLIDECKKMLISETEDCLGGWGLIDCDPVLVSTINTLGTCKYSGTPLVRPPLLHQKSGFLRGVASHRGIEISILMLRFTRSSGLSRRGGLSKGWPLKRGSTVDVISII